MTWKGNRDVIRYKIDGKMVNVHVSYNSRHDVLTAHTNTIKTTSELDRAVEAISLTANRHSLSPLEKLRNRVKKDEVPHAEMLLKFGHKLRLSFDKNRDGLCFFVQHKEIPDNEMLEVLTAPRGGMSRSDWDEVGKIRHRQTHRR